MPRQRKPPPHQKNLSNSYFPEIEHIHTKKTQSWWWLFWKCLWHGTFISLGKRYLKGFNGKVTSWISYLFYPGPNLTNACFLLKQLDTGSVQEDSGYQRCPREPGLMELQWEFRTGWPTFQLPGPSLHLPTHCCLRFMLTCSCLLVDAFSYPSVFTATVVRLPIQRSTTSEERDGTRLHPTPCSRGYL